MHNKRKGNVGQQALAYWLVEHGFSVFAEVGDISKVDLIAEKDGRLIRFQCKAVTPKNGRLLLPLRKCGPGYRWKYTLGLFDYFAIYDLLNRRLYLVSSSVLAEREASFVLRIEPSRNQQKQGTRNAEEFLADRRVGELLALVVGGPAGAKHSVEGSSPSRLNHFGPSKGFRSPSGFHKNL